MDFPVHYSDNLVFTDPARQPTLEKKIKHYSNFHKILLVGEGDFSFSLALANAFGSAENMIPTSLDSREKVESSYENGQKNLQLLERFGAMTVHGVDATKMCKHEIIRERLFDRIVFNFPHAAFYGNEKETDIIRKHRRLVVLFFKNASTMLSRTGEIHVTHKVKDPYSQWKVVEEAEECGLFLKESVEFNKADYPGYTNRRGAEPKVGGTFNLGECRTYMFILRELMTAPIMLPKNSLEALPEILKAAILELETDRKNREAAETAKANLQSSFNHLKTVADKLIEERDEFKRQRNEAIQQRDEALREKENVTKQLGEALRLKEDAVEQRGVSISELAFERKARKAAETAKANVENSFNQYKRSVHNLKQKKTNQLVKQRDHALCQMEETYSENKKIAEQLDEALRLKEEVTKGRERFLKERNEAYWEKGKIAKQLDEALRLKEGVTKERERFIRERNDLSNQKDEAYMEKEQIAKQLDEALRLKEEITNGREKILRERNELANQKNEACCEKGKIFKQLDEALKLKEKATKEKERILKYLRIGVFLYLVISLFCSLK